MNKQQSDLIHWQNKSHQLQQLLDLEREKNKKLKQIISEVRFTGKALINRLENV
jgi:hypothetical protein